MKERGVGDPGSSLVSWIETSGKIIPFLDFIICNSVHHVIWGQLRTGTLMKSDRRGVSEV